MSVLLRFDPLLLLDPVNGPDVAELIASTHLLFLRQTNLIVLVLSKRNTPRINHQATAGNNQNQYFGQFGRRTSRPISFCCTTVPTFALPRFLHPEIIVNTQLASTTPGKNCVQSTKKNRCTDIAGLPHTINPPTFHHRK